MPQGSGRFEIPEPIEVLGHLALTPWVTDVWGYADEQGREFAVVGSAVERTGAGTLFVVEVTDPEHLTVASQLADVPALDVKVRGSLAYASDDRASAGIVVDLSDPYAAEVVGSMPAAHNFSFDHEGRLYPARDLSGAVYSVAEDPLAPRRLGWELPGHHDSLTIGDHLYVFGGWNPTYLFEVAGASDPVLVATLDDPVVTYHHSGWPTSDGNHLFIADEFAEGRDPDVTIWDIGDPSQPVLVAEYVHPGAAVHNIQIVGDFAFLSHYGAGFVVLDVSDPLAPSEAASYDPVPGTIDGWAFEDYGTFGVYAFAPSGNIYVSGSDGLTILRFNPSRRLPASAHR